MRDDDDDDDCNDGDDRRSKQPPAFSRMGVGRDGARRYRSLRRATSRARRWRQQLPIDVLLGQVIREHGLNDDIRRHAVCLYWFEIAGDRIATKTYPIALANGTLTIAAVSSSWVHELQFHRAKLLQGINAWAEANQAWLGPAPLVRELRVSLAARHRERLVERQDVERLRNHQRRPPQRPARPPQPPSSGEQEAIRAEASHVDDPEVRAVIESIRLKWNR